MWPISWSISVWGAVPLINSVTSILFKEIQQDDLQIGNGNSCCEFEFKRISSRADCIICELKISQETNPKDMTMNFEHNTSKLMKRMKISITYAKNNPFITRKGFRAPVFVCCCCCCCFFFSVAIKRRERRWPRASSTLFEHPFASLLREKKFGQHLTQG